jgi:hypothetical protein
MAHGAVYAEICLLMVRKKTRFRKIMTRELKEQVGEFTNLQDYR